MRNKAIHFPICVEVTHSSDDASAFPPSFLLAGLPIHVFSPPNIMFISFYILIRIYFPLKKESSVAVCAECVKIVSRRHCAVDTILQFMHTNKGSEDLFSHTSLGLNYNCFSQGVFFSLSIPIQFRKIESRGFASRAFPSFVSTAGADAVFWHANNSDESFCMLGCLLTVYI